MPSLVHGTDVRSLPIGPEEAYVLSRIDGHTSEVELAQVTGLDEARVHQYLVRLHELGAIRFAHESPAIQQPRQPQGSATSQHRTLPRQIIETTKREASASRPPSGLYDPTELDESVELDIDRKRKVLDAFHGLDKATHYALLDIRPDADRRAVKAAYFEAVNVFHPDRYFGKSLGTFKNKLERVFARITEAHDVLTRPGPRADYDAYLAAQSRTQELERFISESQRPEQLQQTLQALAEEAKLAQPSDPATPGSTLLTPVTPEIAADPEAQRRAISRKLKTPASRLPRRPAQLVPLSEEERREQLAKGLRARYESRVNDARAHQIKEYLKIADDALDANKAVSAATALRMALHLASDDAALRARLEDVEQLAHTEMSDNYLAQAAYEEQTGRFAEAALSYEKASRGKPTAKVFNKVAVSSLRAGDALHTAVEFARKAVRAEPEVIQYRHTLIQAYLGAGLKNSALAEIERAESLAPDDEQIRGWLKQAKHGEL